MNNFHALIGIINGINSASISRLRVTMAEIDMKHLQTFQTLEKFAENSSNFSKLRKAIQHTKPPAVPYLFNFQLISIIY